MKPVCLISLHDKKLRHQRKVQLNIRDTTFHVLMHVSPLYHLSIMLSVFSLQIYATLILTGFVVTTQLTIDHAEL